MIFRNDRIRSQQSISSDNPAIVENAICIYLQCLCVYININICKRYIYQALHTYLCFSNRQSLCITSLIFDNFVKEICKSAFMYAAST